MVGGGSVGSSSGVLRSKVSNKLTFNMERRDGGQARGGSWRVLISVAGKDGRGSYLEG